jgi:hypothetical protein
MRAADELPAGSPEKGTGGKLPVDRALPGARLELCRLAQRGVGPVHRQPDAGRVMATPNAPLNRCGVLFTPEARPTFCQIGGRPSA